MGKMTLMQINLKKKGQKSKNFLIHHELDHHKLKI